MLNQIFTVKIELNRNKPIKWFILSVISNSVKEVLSLKSVAVVCNTLKEKGIPKYKSFTSGKLFNRWRMCVKLCSTKSIFVELTDLKCKIIALDHKIKPLINTSFFALKQLENRRKKKVYEKSSEWEKHNLIEDK